MYIPCTVHTKKQQNMMDQQILALEDFAFPALLKPLIDVVTIKESSTGHKLDLRVEGRGLVLTSIFICNNIIYVMLFRLH